MWWRLAGVILWATIKWFVHEKEQQRRKAMRNRRVILSAVVGLVAGIALWVLDEFVFVGLSTILLSIAVAIALSGMTPTSLRRTETTTTFRPAAPPRPARATVVEETRTHTEEEPS